MNLLVDIISHAGMLTVVAVLISAVLLNESEKRHRREARGDINERARARAASQEALAKHAIYSVPPADRRVERRWGK